MRTFYLVDYENVGSEGLKHCKKLSDKDRVVIFFTKNAPKIDMTQIANLRKNMLDMIEVPIGKQSADMHISSYIGYLIGKYKSKDCRIVVISRDTDFDNLISSWNNGNLTEAFESGSFLSMFHKNTKIKVSKVKKIQSDLSIQNANQQIQSKPKIIKLNEDQKPEFYRKIVEAVLDADIDEPLGNEVTQLLVDLCSEEQSITDIHNELQNRYKEYLKMYRAIKPILSEYQKEAQNPN